MLQRVLSPVLVGRQEELFQLEDALLSANRGDGRFVLLAGEAGIGKTRLATELTRRARKLGCALSGAAARRWSSRFPTCRSSRRSETT
jgi:MoxR-like ATPase